MDSQSSTSSTGNQQIVRRRLQHVQQIPEAVEPAPQDPEYAEGQLLKSIAAALTLAGFDSVKPTALEMFRSHAEECEYMPHLNTYIRAFLTLRQTCFTSSAMCAPQCKPTDARYPQRKTFAWLSRTCPTRSQHLSSRLNSNYHSQKMSRTHPYRNPLLRPRQHPTSQPSYNLC
jgi:hypothetical protein